MLSRLIFFVGCLIEPFLILSSYISNTNSFPKPLSKEEETLLLKEYAEGSEKARNILIERNLRLVAHIVKKYNNTGKDTDDLISIGTIGLIKAISTFDASKGTRLATYAARCIENEILMTIRASKKSKGEVYLQEPIGMDKEGNEISLLDILGADKEDISDEIHLKFQEKKLYEAINKVLKKREKKILELRYGLVDGVCMTQREIASMLGISRSYVSRIEKRAIDKLNKALNS
ncbi:MAG TPA: RNA polymerase sporulation sigma factor SigK [Tissierellia bacterium]|nr:RNA polymerase sporulation sigma factor SigK [Tissierellia bacterium]